jgi:hypothetical protein
MIYRYVKNINERSEFAATVLSDQGGVVFEIPDIDRLWELIDQAFMRDRNDINGLCEYLDHVGIIGADDRLVSGN